MSKDKTKKIMATAFSNRKGLPKPTEETDRRLGFTKWGAKNDYPFYLIDMYNGSAWHQGIIKTKTYYVAGGGIKTVSGDLTKFLKNKYNDFTIEEIFKNVAFDFELFDGFAVIGTWSKDGTKVVRWEHKDLDDVRTNSDESLYYLSDDWNAQKQSKEKTNFREIKPLDEKNRSGKFIIYYKSPSKKSRGEKGIYPKPNYIGGLTAINTDVEISKYHLYEIQQGFKGGTLISMNSGIPETTEEAEAIRDEIKGDTTSVEDAGEVVIVFSDNGDNAPTVMALNGNDLADRYAMTEDSVQQNILVCHSVTTPSLFGIQPEGSFNSVETLELFEVFKNTYVSSRQETLNWLLSEMIRLSGEQGTAELEQAEPIGAEAQAIEDAQPTDSNAPVVDGEEVENVAGSAMNGAQIASMVAIVEAVGLGTLTPDAAVQVIMVAFPTITRDEAERIVGISGETAAPEQQFRSADKDLAVFRLYGDTKDKFKIVKSISVSNEFGASDVEKMENGNFTIFFDKIGDIKAGLTEVEKNVLSLLKKGESGTDIAQAIDAPLVEVAKAYENLRLLNLIVDGETSALGEKVLDGLDVEVDQFEVRYSYEVKAGLGDDVIPTTRDFCKELIRQDRMYLRSEINTITSAIGRDVWRYRGGFYTRPNGGRTTPWCRHEWVQHLVIKN